MVTELSTFSALLRRYRADRGLSLTSLATCSGIGKTTLCNWEAGRTRPSTPELERLIGALGLSEPETLLLRRFVARSRSLIVVPEGERPPLTGGLLRALRLRCRLSQSEVARKLEIRQGTLAKWERSEDWPAPDRLSALCLILRARPEETAAILGGVFLPLPLPLNTPLEVVGETVAELARTALQAPDRPLLDLRFLELESLLQFQSERVRARELLCQLWSGRAAFLCLQGRYSEAEGYTDRILQLPPELLPSDRVALETALLMKGKIRQRALDAPGAYRVRQAQAALGFLQSQETDVQVAEFQAWYWMLVGELLLATGEREEAWEAIQRSNATPHPDGARLQTQEASLLTASYLSDLGRPHEALELLESVPIDQHLVPGPRAEVRRLLYRTKALLELGQVPEATVLLDQSYQHLEEAELYSLRPLADSLSFRMLYVL